MDRIHLIQPDLAPTEIKNIFEQLQKKLGKVPNIFLGMGNSVAALNAYMKLSECAEQTSLPKELREQLALAIAETNKCRYCLSAHSMIAKGMNISESDILNSRKGDADDPKTKAILHFAKTTVEKRGEIDDREISNLKAHGVSDQEIVEIILVISLNMFTNLFNQVANTPIDFPLAPQLP